MAVNELQKQRGRGPGRPFQKGQSGNPAGRPMGSRNRATQLAEAILDDNAEAIFQKLVELSLAGRETMLKLAAERIVPRRSRAVALDLPQIASTADLAPAIAAIAHAVAAGGLTPYDGAELARIFDAYAHAAEFGEFERRLRAVERNIEGELETNHAPAD